MKTFIIILIIVILIVVILRTVNFLKRKKSRSHNIDPAAAEAFRKYLEMTIMLKKTMGSQGTDADVIPEGTGEFGLEVTNPIPTSTNYGSISYLGKLRTLDGVKVEYERRGSYQAANIPSMIDGYKITANGKDVATIFLCPYNKKNSEIAPRGFKLAPLPFVE